MSNERMSWGYGGERMWSAEPISPHGSMFRGRAGVVVEFAPNQFMSWQMTGSFGTVEMERDETDLFASDRVVRTLGLTVVRFSMEGMLVANERHAPRPDWATEPAGEIEGRRAIGGRS